jgi:hypothetical protein
LKNKDYDASVKEAGSQTRIKLLAEIINAPRQRKQMTVRQTILAKLIEDEQIKKMAQEVGAVGEKEIDQATADRLANEIFDKLFDEELKTVINKPI